MAKIPAGVWVVVGDGEKALFMRNEGDEAFPDLHVIREVAHENPPTREQGTDTPGRMRDTPRASQTNAPTTQHVSAVSETDWHRIEKARFAKELSDLLYSAAHRGAFDQLIIVAPPVVLGELRPVLHKEVTQRLLYDVAKELTNHTVDDIRQALASA